MMPFSGDIESPVAGPVARDDEVSQVLIEAVIAVYVRSARARPAIAQCSRHSRPTKCSFLRGAH
jgi:hypothetical protein